MEPSVQNAMAAELIRLREFGPSLGRPAVGKLSNSKYPNLKELRFDAADGVWRVAFAFDPLQRAVLLVAGDKSGGSEKKFYNRLIDKADRRYAAHLKTVKVEKEAGKKAATAKGGKL